jgi:hypothetical protein
VSSNILNPRKPILWLIGVAAAAAFFASGALVARATLDDGQPAAQIIVPGIGRDAANDPPASLNTGQGSAGSSGAKGGPVAPDGAPPYAGCQAPLPTGLVGAGGIDFSKAGIVPAFPTSGFTALNVNIAAMGDCGKDGNAASGQLVLASAWRHDATGLQVYLSQTATSDKTAAVLRGTSATFWANGYLFQANVNPYPIAFATDGGAGDGKSTSSGPATQSPSGASSNPASPARPPESDPRAAAVLKELLGQIAPSFNQQCFWVATDGDWSALAAAGIGDPRPAIPSGFTEAGFSATAFNPPAAGCDTSLKPTDGFQFSANWQKNANSNDFAYIGINAYSSPGGGTFGQLNEYGANWSNGTYQFSIGAKAAKPIGLDTIRAIAKALDPGFNDACFVQDRDLKESELAGLGLGTAKVPSGYKQTASVLRATEIAAGCPNPDGFQPSYSTSWTFQKGADVIEAGGYRNGGQPAGARQGFKGPNNLSWNNGNGTSYHVNAYSTGISPNVSMDDLVAVAKSMDPGFDVSTLQDNGGIEKGIPLPAPAPARD